MADPVSLKPIGTTPSQPLHLVEPEEGTISHRSNKDNDHVRVLQRRISKSPPKRHQDHEDCSDINDTQSSSTFKDVIEETARLGLPSAAESTDSGRERLKRHRSEVAGRVWIPEIWGQEELLKDWIDCSAFDASLIPTGIMSARAALIHEGRRAAAGRLRIENRC